MNYYIQQNDKIILFDTNKERLVNTLAFISEYSEDNILETSKNIIEKNKIFYIEDDEALVSIRQQEFYTHFIKTSLGNYRLQPKGYANAQQAMDVTNTMVTALGGLTEQLTNLVIFYETPDFTKEEECTEEWLVAHQIKPNVMTLAEWQKFYLEFCQLYAMQQYKSEVVNENTTDTTTDNADTVQDELQSETN
mgnify:CR=1 FL=1|nr:MAG TPA: hypothetical protein [Caudoviricetes sp.]